MGSWAAQADHIVYGPSIASEPGFDFALDVDEPGSRRGAEVLLEQGPKVSERKPLCGWSEFFGLRPIVMTS